MCCYMSSKFTEGHRHRSKKKKTPRNKFAFRYIISTISAQPQTCFDGKMTLNTKPAFPTRKLQRATIEMFPL